MKQGFCVLLALILIAGTLPLRAEPPKPNPLTDPFRKEVSVEILTPLDQCLERTWKSQGIPLPAEASDSVLVRRIYLDLLGRVPTVSESKLYVQDTAKDKRRRLVNRLLKEERFAEYWSNRFSDILRVKSEFPINLWPNAVYGYRQRIFTFLRTNERYDHFVRALLLSEGSNFRVPEVNFYRANAVRDPENFAKSVLQTFLGTRLENLTPERRNDFIQFFRCCALKSTKEWKEEILFVRDLETPEKFRLPNGQEITVRPGEDPRVFLADFLLAPENPDFAGATVNRIWSWFFGSALSGDADDITLKNTCSNHELLQLLTGEFIRSGYDIRELCRIITGTAAYRATSISASGDPRKQRQTFAVYPVRRLDSEVLEDSIRAITGMKIQYSSVIPEPFTFLPEDQATVQIADGSISSSFQILFGRPPRDSGLQSERSGGINAKQRLYLFNSGKINDAVNRILQPFEIRNKNWNDKVQFVYWTFYSRPPTPEEFKLIQAEYKKIRDGRERWRFPTNLCWILMNSKEFLYQH